ncbi:MAG: RDD family protein [Cellvibrio sp.]|jgi:Predicted membrane protein/domain
MTETQAAPDAQATNTPPTAGVLRRFAAIVYDSLLLIALSIGYGALALFINVAIQGEPPEGQKVQWGHWSILMFIGWMFTLAGFFCYFWRRSGQTLGMRAWRMKLVDAELRSPTLKQCAIRCVIAPFSLLLGGLGYFWRWFDPQKLTLHDRLSHTQVIVLPKDKK